MKKMLVIAVVMLSGCAYNATLYPRGGGTTLTGEYNKGSRSMSVALDGSAYEGDVVNGMTNGMAFAVGRSFTTMPMMMQNNQHSATLVGPRGAIRCDFMVQGSSGNGVCQGPDSTVYDLVLKVQ